MDTRRLDALLAIHLFGLDAVEQDVVCVRERGTNNAWQDTNNAWHDAIYDVAAPWARAGHRKRRKLVVPGGPGDYVEVDHYSTTWAGMGLVVDAMRERGWDFCLQSFHDADDVWAKFGALNRDGREGSHSDRSPTAVALDALRALGVEVTDED